MVFGFFLAWATIGLGVTPPLAAAMNSKLNMRDAKATVLQNRRQNRLLPFAM